LNVAEIFHSVQGEIDVGMNAVFLRLSGCNLISENRGCKFCDTLYAEQQRFFITPEDISETLFFTKSSNVVVTGGEPLLQKEDILSLITILRGSLRERYSFYLETNGTLWDPKLGYLFKKISCSPKKQAIDSDILNRYARLSNCRFKFVYENSSDLWWEQLISFLGISSESVWIMPEGVTSETQFMLSSEVIDYCKLKRFNFSPRLHTLLWGNQRGV